MTKEELRTLRTTHGLTQRQLADGLGVKVTKISEWENGRYQTISPAYRKLLTDYFDKLETK
ncbi:helix-turn-helix domain-containing protein [Rufibacter soli]